MNIFLLNYENFIISKKTTNQNYNTTLGFIKTDVGPFLAYEDVSSGSMSYCQEKYIAAKLATISAHIGTCGRYQLTSVHI